MDTVSVTGLTFIVTGAVALVLHQLAVRHSRARSDADQQRIRELELEIHAATRKFLAERNELELAHHEALNEERTKLSRLRAEHAEAMVRERDAVSTESRDQARREFESQASLFCVSVRPYVRITKDEGFFNSACETQTGYQYQLMINGIPAFQPHIIVESTDTAKKFNEENLKALIQQATRAAEAAVSIYLDKAGRSFSLAQPLVERLSR